MYFTAIPMIKRKVYISIHTYNTMNMCKKV